MSWNLLIYKPRDAANRNQTLGYLDVVKEAFSDAFDGLEWSSATEAELAVEGGFRLELTEVRGEVQDASTQGGLGHLAQLAKLCKQEGWQVADAEEGEDIDLDEPQRWVEENGG